MSLLGPAQGVLWPQCWLHQTRRIDRFLQPRIFKHFIWTTVPRFSHRRGEYIPYYFCSLDYKIFLSRFPFSFFRGPFGRIMRIFRSLSGPSYDGKYLHEVVRKKLGTTRLCETLTDVVIPTFDIKRLQPIIFSSYEVYAQPPQCFIPVNIVHFLWIHHRSQTK